MKIICIDIETSPHITYAFGLFNQNIGINQIEEPTRMMCFAAQWADERNIMFYSEQHDGKEEMVKMAWKLLNEADAVITYNGDKFDLPHLNREFLAAGLTPPAPYISIDLLKTVRRQFKHASNKLDWIAQQLNVGAKTPHTGFQLWLDCMHGDEKAWQLMRKYNCQDVKVTLGVYKKILPWISSHPHVALHNGSSHGCPNCGSFKAIREGYAFTAVSRFQRFKCRDCGKWYREGSRNLGASALGIK